MTQPVSQEAREANAKAILAKHCRVLDGTQSHMVPEHHAIAAMLELESTIREQCAKDAEDAAGTIGAAPGSSIHSALVFAANAIRKGSKA